MKDTGGRAQPSSQHAGDIQAQSAPLSTAEVDALLVYTRPLPTPRLIEALFERRFLARLLQFAVATTCFAALALAVFDVNYTPAVIGSSGTVFMATVAVASLVRCLVRRRAPRSPHSSIVYRCTRSRACFCTQIPCSWVSRRHDIGVLLGSKS